MIIDKKERHFARRRICLVNNQFMQIYNVKHFLSQFYISPRQHVVLGLSKSTEWGEILISKKFCSSQSHVHILTLFKNLKGTMVPVWRGYSQQPGYYTFNIKKVHKMARHPAYQVKQVNQVPFPLIMRCVTTHFQGVDSRQQSLQNSL